jgi:23S rRNA (adenine2503-C2)-methyltransferase
VQAFVQRLGDAAYHGRQIFGWIYRRDVRDFASMTDLPLALRGRLAETATVSAPVIAGRDVSSDGTTKYLLGLGDGRQIEAVFIPDTPAQTFCISTQVGCAMRCGFCLTGKMGLVRNLTAAEIAGQVLVLARDQRLWREPFNIVLMGMGEPLHNYDATMKALRILGTPEGMGVPARRVTLSTVGVLPALERLATEPYMPNLAISLHATTDAQRDALVPVNKKYRLQDLIDACTRFPVKRRERITFEYVLLEGVNDTPEDARRLVRLLAGVRAKVNLLPLNEAPGIPFRRPSDDRVDRFARYLAERGITVMVRKSRGRDIRAACGQLIVDGPQASPAQRMAELIGR